MPSPHGPWTRHETSVGYSTPHLRAHRDQVTRPDGQADQYDWFEAPDQVRVAAIIDSDLLLIDQHHYLIGRSLQLPGGSVDPDETAHKAARRELRQETGYRRGNWSKHGFLYPVPGLSRMRIHLWSARNLTLGQPQPEPSEGDLKVVRLSLPAAVRAALNGRVRCAASVALILAVAHHTAAPNSPSSPRRSRGNSRD